MFAHGQPGMKDWFLSTGNWQNDPQIYVCEFGTGTDTVVMLHGGWGGDHFGMIEAVAGLSNKFHFILYDQRGSLRSPFPDSLITFDQHIEDVERLRKELKMEKMNIVGHSMGASYPVSIIMGDHDFLDFGAGLAKKWSAELPRMKLHIIPKAGHIIWVDQPGEFSRFLSYCFSH